MVPKRGRPHGVRKNRWSSLLKLLNVASPGEIAVRSILQLGDGIGVLGCLYRLRVDIKLRLPSPDSEVLAGTGKSRNRSSRRGQCRGTGEEEPLPILGKVVEKRDQE
jgi:hypothetical protein